MAEVALSPEPAPSGVVMSTLELSIGEASQSAEPDVQTGALAERSIDRASIHRDTSALITERGGTPGRLALGPDRRAYLDPPGAGRGVHPGKA